MDFEIKSDPPIPSGNITTKPNTPVDLRDTDLGESIQVSFPGPVYVGLHTDIKGSTLEIFLAFDNENDVLVGAIEISDLPPFIYHAAGTTFDDATYQKFLFNPLAQFQFERGKNAEQKNGTWVILTYCGRQWRTFIWDHYEWTDPSSSS